MMKLSVTPEQFEETQKRQNNIFYQGRVFYTFKLLGFTSLTIAGTILVTSFIESILQPQTTGELNLLLFIFGLPFLILFGFYLAVFIHEIGHVVAGRANGFKIVKLVVGPLMLIKTFSKWQLQFSGLKGSQIGGFVIGIPERSNNLADRLSKFYWGGLIANLLQVIFLVLVQWLLRNETVPYMVGLGWDVSLKLAIVLIFMSAIPMNFAGLLNDGARIRDLRKRGTVSNYLENYFLLLADSIQGRRPRDLNQNFIEESKRSATRLLESLWTDRIAYAQALDLGQVSQAASILDDILIKLSKDTKLYVTPIILLEAAFFEAFYNQDATRARGWFDLARKQYKKITPFVSPNIILRAEATVLLAEGHYESAKQQAREAIKWLDRDFDLGSAIAEREWLETIIARSENSLEGKTKSEKLKLYQHKGGLRSTIRTLLVTIFGFMIIICVLAPSIVAILEPNFRYQIIGSYYDLRGEESKAIAAFTAGIESGSENSAHNYTNRGDIYLRQGLYTEAASDFNKAIALRPDLYDPYMGRAVVYYSLGEFELAVEDFSQSLELEPSKYDLVDIYFYRAAAYSYLDEYEHAAADYRQILAISEDAEEIALAEQYLQAVGYSKR